MAGGEKESREERRVSVVSGGCSEMGSCEIDNVEVAHSIQFQDAFCHPAFLITIFVASAISRLRSKKCRETRQEISRKSLRSPVSRPA